LACAWDTRGALCVPQPSAQVSVICRRGMSRRAECAAMLVDG